MREVHGCRYACRPPVPGAVVIRVERAPARRCASATRATSGREVGKQNRVRRGLSVGGRCAAKTRSTAGRSAQADRGKARRVLRESIRREEVGRHEASYISPRCRSKQIGCGRMCHGASDGETTWSVLELVAPPDVVSTGSVMLGGIWGIKNRRAEVAKKRDGDEQGALARRQKNDRLPH